MQILLHGRWIVNPKLALAMGQHQDGVFLQAAVLYRELLAVEPRNADALHLLGVLMHQIGQSQTAAQLIGCAIQINPEYAPYHNNMGNALRAIGDTQGAKHSFKRSILLDPRTPSTYVNLGSLEHTLECWEAAEENFHAALRWSSEDFDALFGLGNLAMAKGEVAVAIGWYERAVSREPRSAGALNALGNAQIASGDQEGAKTHYLAAAEYAPSNPDAHINLGNVYMAQKQFDRAIQSYERAVHCAPSDHGAVTLLGIAHLKNEDAEQAMSAFARAVQLNPGHARSHLFLGHSLSKGKHFQLSIRCFEEAIRLNPNYDEAHNSLGVAYEGLGEYSKAGESFATALSLGPDSVEHLVNVGLNLTRRKNSNGVQYLERALELDPDHIDAHVVMAEIRLTLGDYERGWREFEWRWRWPEFADRVRSFTQPMWNGQPLNQQVILLHSEQGYGDTIQFVRYIREVMRLGGTVILEVQPLLYRLLKEVPGVHACLRQGDSRPQFDVHCPLLSLPHVLGAKPDSLPPPIELRATCGTGTHLKSSGPDQFLRVGLVWAGNSKHKRDSFRSMPLPLLLPLREVPGVTFLSLQKEIPNHDLDALSNFPIEQALTSCEDFLDTAGVIDSLDLVIGVDTSVAHLAASMGKPVWLMLPEAADWRWGLEGEQTQWYPTMRLFRQTAEDGRTGLVSCVLTALCRFSQKHAFDNQTPRL